MSTLFKMTGTASAIATVFTGALLVALPAAPAFAQSGSRLCGYSAPLPNEGRIGLLFEARQNDASYSRECSEAIDSIWNTIKADPQLKNFTWTRHEKEKCEDVSNHFAVADMCDQMEAKAGYLVKKTKIADESPADGEKLTQEERMRKSIAKLAVYATTFEKQDSSKSGISSILP